MVVVGLADRRAGAARRPAHRRHRARGRRRARSSDLAGLFRRIWSLGEAGVEVPLSIYRDGRTLDLNVASADRNRFLKTQSLH